MEPNICDYKIEKLRIQDMMKMINDYISRFLLLHNINLPINFVTYQDKIRFRGPNYNKTISYGHEGNDIIWTLIDGNLPMMISKLGFVELSCLSFYIEKRLRKKRKYPESIKRFMVNNAGFFPADDQLFDRFAELYFEQLKNADIMGVWFNHFEDMICNNYSKDARLVEVGCLEPFRFKNPWSRALKGKKVLVVHPFTESIKKQYSEKRQFLFKNPDILPKFELKTVKAIQSIAGTNVDFETWFDAYDYMCGEIEKENFDIAIIGAGAYGLPLASFVKRLGRQAIHLGGVTQILFGIKGRRWETAYADSTANLFNEHWIRPSEAEIPAGYNKVEDGCYW